MATVYDYVSKNLTITHKDDLSFPFLDVGFLYGYGLFESIPVVNGKTILLEDHVHRLRNGAMVLDIPVNYSLEQFRSAVEKLVQKNNLEAAVLNFYLTPGDRHVDPANTDIKEPLLLIVARKWPGFQRSDTISLDVRQESFQKAPLDGYKTLSWIKNILEKRLNSELDDVLLYDEDYQLLETTRANVFFIKKGAVITPKSSVILNGVTRKCLLKNSEVLGFDVVERSIYFDELETFEEIFLTNSLRGVFFVSRLEGCSGLCSGDQAKKIQDLYWKIVGQN